jgi:hypothetical protein
MCSRVLGGHTRQLAAVAHGDKRQVLVADAAHDPLGATIDSRGPVVAPGLDGVADEDALLPDSPRDDADVELALIVSPLLDGVVDRVRLSVGTGNQHHAFAACVPVEVRVDHSLTRRFVMIARST